MKLNYIIPILLLLTIGRVEAQNTLKGSVVESGTNTKLPEAFVHDMNSKQMTLTDVKGNFQIPTAVGHILIFSSPGYVSDTLYLVDLVTRTIKLTPQSIALREVSIRSTRFDPRRDYPEIYQRSKVYVLSPTTWFGKDAKDARRLKHYFAREVEERHVDSIFTRAYVSSIVPLKGQQLEDFMTMYRPSYAFLHSNNGESLAVYINDSYKKYQALPPDKRTMPRLTSQ
ncbi:carboxypeptidase-like regulatory domain-containing protein [Mucilaginibacter robiniae]|uniref:Carboxypeptidase-like regulatory domain-containing protein n=1 Tax=Mucilaginibacter robiniae TaxID=2728022 RepID=A0A7L5E9N5_9SPHI|nr:carboxypeptidase-like regulatory domain-containing protein [Mucilaginibacter robiniae]QJD97096.1 carboxypeptidase-like regulatory domain-containing protein [Mucilaginibacter robiniae]